MNRVIRSRALKEGQGTPQSGARCSFERGGFWSGTKGFGLGAEGPPVGSENLVDEREILSLSGQDRPGRSLSVKPLLTYDIYENEKSTDPGMGGPMPGSLFAACRDRQYLAGTGLSVVYGGSVWECMVDDRFALR